jgi:SAF domain
VNWRPAMWTWPALAVGLLGGASVLAPLSFEKTVQVPRSDIPAFTAITADQLEAKTVKKRDLDDSALGAADDLVGHVSRKALAKGEPVPEDSVTATAPASYGGQVVVAFHADATSAGKVKTGSSVRLLFAPKGDAEGVEPLEIGAVLLDSNDVKAGGTNYVVALSSQDRTRLLRVVARSNLLIVPG